MTTRILRNLTLPIAAIAVFSLPALAGSQVEKTLSVADGAMFVLDSDAGSVEVIATNDPNATVTISSDKEGIENLLQIRTKSNSYQTRFTARKNDDMAWRDGISVKYTVRVPAGTKLDLRTPVGDLKVPALGANSRVVTNGGRLVVEPSSDVRASK